MALAVNQVACQIAVGYARMMVALVGCVITGIVRGGSGKSAFPRKLCFLAFCANNQLSAFGDHHAIKGRLRAY